MSLPAGVSVRRGRPGDAAYVLPLIQQLGYTPAERRFDETFAQVVRHPEAAVFVATEGLRVIGYLAMSHRAQITGTGLAALIGKLDLTAPPRLILWSAMDDEMLRRAGLDAGVPTISKALRPSEIALEIERLAGN
jgi:hypothetical protein